MPSQDIARVRIQADTRLKASSKIYRCQTVDANLRFRPEWKARLIREHLKRLFVSRQDCKKPNKS